MADPFEHASATRPLGRDEAESLAEGMRAFATGSRLRLLYALIEGERTVDQLAAATDQSPNATSQQLRVLRHLSLVAVRRDGRHAVYRLHDAHVADLLRAVRHHAEHAALAWTDG